MPIKIMDNIAALPKGVGGIITKGGTLYTWGPNNCGDNGNGADAGVGSDVPVKVMDNVIQACHGGTGAAITADGGLYMWGDNEYGSLGNGRSGMSNYSSTPIKIMDGAAVVSIGQECSSAITDDGTLYTWGRNDGGRLGNGEHGLHTHEDTPVKIMNNTTFVDMGNSHTAAISKDGSLYMWGRNTYGQLGNGKSGEDPSNYEYCEGVDSDVPIRVIIPADEPVNSAAPEFGLMSVSNTLSAGEPFTGLLPNEIYNVYGMRSRTVANPFSPDNLLYIYASGNLYYDYQPVADCTEPVIFCKAMREFPVGNVRISGADVTETGITVKWEAYLNADMYRVYRVVNGIYLELGTTAATSFTVSNPNSNWEYGFLVSSRVNGEWSYPSPEDVAYIATSADAYTLGDVNGDGAVTLDDAILTLKFAMNVDLGDANFIERAADVSGNDGSITLDDAIAILKIAMNVSA